MLPSVIAVLSDGNAVVTSVFDSASNSALISMVTVAAPTEVTADEAIATA